MHQKYSIPGQKIKKFLERSTAPCPDPSKLGTGHPMPKPHPLGSDQIVGERGGTAFLSRFSLYDDSYLQYKQQKKCSLNA